MFKSSLEAHYGFVVLLTLDSLGFSALCGRGVTLELIGGETRHEVETDALEE